MDISAKLNFPKEICDRLDRLTESIDSFTCEWNACTKTADEEKAARAFSQTVVSSFSLEGRSVSEEDARAIMPGMTDGNGLPDDIYRYAQALDAVWNDDCSIALDDNYIVKLHDLLFPVADADPTKQKSHGSFLNFWSERTAASPQSRQNPVSTHVELQELLRWTAREREVHPLRIVATFAYEFISCHPFREGKGELSRLLTLRLLHLYGYDWCRAVSIDRLIEHRRVEYYQALKTGQQERYTSRENIAPWVLLLLEIFEQATLELGNKPLDEHPGIAPKPQEEPNPKHPAGHTRAKNCYLNPRQKKIFAFVKAKQPVKVADVAAYMKPVSVNTLKKDLFYLRENGIIHSSGMLKGTVYFVEEE